MYTYQCLFCGGKYAAPRAMTTCTVCGHTTSSGWLREESGDREAQRRQVVHASPSYRLPMLKVAA